MSDFVYREPAKIIADILQAELGLKDGQVMLSNQKFIIPTNGLYISISYVGPGKVIARGNDWQDDGSDGLTEVQSVTMLDMIQIDMMSFDNAARERRTELAMALGSIYSESQQEKYAMQISRNMGPVMDTSYLEGNKILTCYTATIMTTSVNRKEKAVDSYASFPTKAYTDLSKKPFADFNAKDEPAVLTAG